MCIWLSCISCNYLKSTWVTRRSIDVLFPVFLSFFCLFQTFKPLRKCKKKFELKATNQYMITVGSQINIWNLENKLIPQENTDRSDTLSRWQHCKRCCRCTYVCREQPIKTWCRNQTFVSVLFLLHFEDSNTKFVSFLSVPDHDIIFIWQLTALLVAKFKANPEFAHLTARENVWDPLDHKRTGLFLILWAGSCEIQTAIVTQQLKHQHMKQTVVKLTNFEEGAQLHRPYRLQPIRLVSFW